jgi:hypothetical protein
MDMLVLKLPWNKRSAYIERFTTPPPSKRRRPHFNTHTYLERIKILIMDLKVIEARNYCAVKGQQQFN